MDDKKLALLIDSDNISAKYIKDILGEVTKYGVVTYKRIYGDWTSPQAGKWRSVLLEYSISPVQQFQNTVGKNATDSAMIIDAMDILYTADVDGFCIVSSDSDFTRLAGRLREAGKEVIGMGESKTPRSFRAACTLFTNLELLEEGENSATSVEIITDDTPEAVPRETIENDIAAIIAENDDKARATVLSEIGNRLVKKYSDFDVRNYGYSTLSRFVSEMDRFEMIDSRGGITVRLKDGEGLKQAAEQYILSLIKEGGKNGVELSILGSKVNREYKNFRVRDYGYSNFANFVRSLPGVKVSNTRGRNCTVKLREE